MSGDTGNQFREQSGSLSSFVLDSLRGLGESIQYQTGKKRLEELDSRTDSLTKEEEKQKKIYGTKYGNYQYHYFNFQFVDVNGGIFVIRKQHD